MDELLASLAVKLSDKVPENVLGLEWDSDEAIRQVDEIYKELGTPPDYTNTNCGGSVRWFDITVPMSFSEIYVEDQLPISLLRGVSYNSSYTIMLHVENRKILKKVPSDLVTYNYNYSRLTCHCSSWKEAVIIASAVHIMDLGRFDQFEPIWNAYKDIEDPTIFVNLLVGEDPQENEETSDETLDENSDENEDENTPNEKQIIIKPIDKITPSPLREEIEGNEESPQPISRTNPSTPKSTGKGTSPDITPFEKKNTQGQKISPPAIKPRKSIKSPMGRPINRSYKVQSPPRSPVRTIVGRSSHPITNHQENTNQIGGKQKMSFRPTSNIDPKLASLIRKK
jgi:hypothetical protein